MVTLCLHSSSHIASDSTQMSTSRAWIERVAAGRFYVWQQDSAPCHTSRSTQLENFCDHITLDMRVHSSSDCYSFDYYVWDEAERDSNKTPCNTKDELKTKIIAALINLNKETVKGWRFRFRLETEIKVNGYFFEINLILYYFNISSSNVGKYIW